MTLIRSTLWFTFSPEVTLSEKVHFGIRFQSNLQHRVPSFSQQVFSDPWFLKMAFSTWEKETRQTSVCHRRMNTQWTGCETILHLWNGMWKTWSVSLTGWEAQKLSSVIFELWFMGSKVTFTIFIFINGRGESHPNLHVSARFEKWITWQSTVDEIS